MKRKIAESFDRDNFLHQTGVQEDLSRGSQVVREGVLKDCNFRIAVRVDFPREEVGVLTGLVFQGTPETGAKGQLEESEGGLGVLLAGEKEVKSRVRNDDVPVRGITFWVTRRGEERDRLRREREKRKLVVQGDRAKGEVTHARALVQDDIISDDHTGTDAA